MPPGLLPLASSASAVTLSSVSLERAIVMPKGLLLGSEWGTLQGDSRRQPH